jgi:hypothetical protein
MNLAGLVRAHLVSAPSHGHDHEQVLERRHDRSVLIVRLYYLIGLYWVAGQMRTWPELRETTVIDPMWAAEWIRWVGVRSGITMILVAYAVAAVVVALVPQHRLARIAYALTLLQYESIMNGFGKSVAMYAWLWVGAALVLLPDGRASWTRRATADAARSFSDVVRLAQLVLLFFYTLTGFWKVYYATLALFDSSASGFSVTGFSYILIETLERTGRETLLGDALASRPLVAWPLYLGTMYLETVAVLIVLRPRLHRIWGVGLIAFHLATQVVMGVWFPSNFILLGLFLSFSPFAPENVPVKDAILDLPGVHLLSKIPERIRARAGGVPVPAS